MDGQTGWLAAPGDARAWADALSVALEAGPSHRALMGAKGRARAQELYSVERMAAATLDAYADLLARWRP